MTNFNFPITIMKNVVIPFVVLVCFLIGCTEKNRKDIAITNATNIERTDELIVLQRSELENKLGTIPAGKFVTVTSASQPVVVQYDDVDGDGNWDELAFLYSFKQNEKAGFSLSIADAPVTIKAVTRAHVRHRKKNTNDSFGPVVIKDTMPIGNKPTDFSKQPLPPYLTEGPTWENDKVAFRLYFDTRNGKDVFGKLIPGMVMDTVGANYNNSYHGLSNWGMDVLHVGKSLGAGSIAIKTRDGKGKDTLIRLGGNNIRKQTYEVVADGPVRAVFRIKYDWEINGNAVHITDETSIWGGQFFYETKLSVTGAPNDSRLVIGFADFYNNEKGRLDTAGITVCHSYGPQSENKDNLGLAVAVRSSEFDSFNTIQDTLSDIQNTHAVLLSHSAHKPVVYRFYAGWERSDKRFINNKTFEEFLKTEEVKFRNSIILKLPSTKANGK
jgi:hypothetical protein